MSENNYKNYIGIDVSKRKLDIAINDAKKIIGCDNSQAGIETLLEALPEPESTLVIMEATGGYEKQVANVLRGRNFAVAVVNAKRVRDFAKASGKFAKTDVIDARMIRLYGKTFNPLAQKANTEIENKRQDYLNRRSQLVRMITLEKQYKEHSSPSIQHEINKHIAQLEELLDSLEHELEKLIEQDKDMKKKVQQLDAIEGVGSITAINVLIHLPELGTLSHKEISALVGVAPFNKDSGQARGKREIKGGRAAVRAALYMAVLSAKKYNPKIKLFYEHLLSKGKLKKVAIVACMRKLLIFMNSMMRDKAQWNPGPDILY